MRPRRPDPGALLLLGVAAVTLDRIRRLARTAAPRHRPPEVLDDKPAGGASRARVVAVVPVRDEAAGIATTLTALLASGPALGAVVVVDDGSRDETLAVVTALRDKRLHVVPAGELAAGLTGKAQACALGARVATRLAVAGQHPTHLWFVDADVRPAPSALASLLAVQEESAAALVSALPALDTSHAGPGAAWLLPALGLVLARRLDLDAVADLTDHRSFASGQSLLVRADAYAEVGGHLAVAHEATEDLALAQAFLRRGHPVRLVFDPGGHRALVRPGLGRAWDGLARGGAAVHGPGRAAWLRAITAAAAPLLALHANRRRPRAVAALLLAPLVVEGVARLVAVPTGATSAECVSALAPALGAPLADLTAVVHLADARRRRWRQWGGRLVRLG